MRFMMLMIPRGYEKAVPGTLPDAEAVAKMAKYNESLQKFGVLLSLNGLHPPSMGTRISFPDGKAKVADGPFPEAKEALGGTGCLMSSRNKKSSSGPSAARLRTTK